MATSPSSPRRSPEPPGLAELRGNLEDMVAETRALEEVAGGPLTDTLAAWLAARYLPALHHLSEQAGPEGIDTRTLHRLCGDIVALRKGDHSAARLGIERERLELERMRDRNRIDQQIREALRDPATRRRLAGDASTPAGRAQRLRELFNLAPPPTS